MSWFLASANKSDNFLKIIIIIQVLKLSQKLVCGDLSNWISMYFNQVTILYFFMLKGCCLFKCLMTLGKNIIIIVRARNKLFPILFEHYFLAKEMLIYPWNQPFIQNVLVSFSGKWYLETKGVRRARHFTESWGVPAPRTALGLSLSLAPLSPSLSASSLAPYLSHLSRLKSKLTSVFLIPVQLILVFSHDCNSSFQQEKLVFFIVILAPGELGHMPIGANKTASLWGGKGLFPVLPSTPFPAWVSSSRFSDDLSWATFLEWHRSTLPPTGPTLAPALHTKMLLLLVNARRTWSPWPVWTPALLQLIWLIWTKLLK